MRSWLVVHPSDELYGADRVLLEAIGALDSQRVTCWLPTDVAYPDRALSKQLRDRGVTVVRRRLPVLRRAYLTGPGLTRLAGRAAAVAVDARRATRTVSHVYLNTSAVLPMAPLMRRRGTRIVVHIHEAWGATERRLLSPLLRFCDATVAVSESVANALPATAEPRVVYNGLPDLAAPPPSEPGTLQVLLASRWSSWKGHREFLQAWQRASLADAHLTIVGATPPSGEGVDVPELVRTLGVTRSVTVLPEQADVSPLLARAHVVAVPSVKPDPLPTIAIEAARAGRAVLASDTGGLPEIVTHDETGWLVPPGDLDAWQGALRQLTVADAVRCGAAGRATFESRFTAERFRSELLTVLR